MIISFISPASDAIYPPPTVSTLTGRMTANPTMTSTPAQVSPDATNPPTPSEKCATTGRCNAAPTPDPEIADGDRCISVGMREALAHGWCYSPLHIGRDGRVNKIWAAEFLRLRSEFFAGLMPHRQ